MRSPIISRNRGNLASVCIVHIVTVLQVIGRSGAARVKHRALSADVSLEGGRIVNTDLMVGQPRPQAEIIVKPDSGFADAAEAQIKLSEFLENAATKEHWADAHGLNEHERLLGAVVPERDFREQRPRVGRGTEASKNGILRVIKIDRPAMPGSDHRQSGIFPEERNCIGSPGRILRRDIVVLHGAHQFAGRQTGRSIVGAYFVQIVCLNQEIIGTGQMPAPFDL